MITPKQRLRWGVNHDLLTSLIDSRGWSLADTASAVQAQILRQPEAKRRLDPLTNRKSLIGKLCDGSQQTIDPELGRILADLLGVAPTVLFDVRVQEQHTVKGSAA